MNDQTKFVVLTLEKQPYALLLSAVERAVRAVEITPLPKAPEIVLGIINLAGRIIPVVNIRKRFRLPEREMALSDHLIIAHTSRRSVALMADSVTGVIERPENQVIPADQIVAGMEHVAGVVKLENGLVLIHNLDLFLSLEENDLLDQAMPKKQGTECLPT